MTSPRHIVSAAGVALGLSIPLALPAGAQGPAAQADDIAYCRKLKNAYERWLSPRSFSDQRGGSSGTQTQAALAQCDNGRHAEAIPQLEQVLRDNGFRLPERAVGSRP